MIPVSELDCSTLLLSSMTQSPQELVELAEEVRSLLDRFASLGNRQLKVAAMRYLYGLEPSEICSSLDLSRKQYEGCLNRARLSLQRDQPHFTSAN